jgi:hypothetical protein
MAMTRVIKHFEAVASDAGLTENGGRAVLSFLTKGQEHAAVTMYRGTLERLYIQIGAELRRQGASMARTW